MKCSTVNPNSFSNRKLLAPLPKKHKRLTRTTKNPFSFLLQGKTIPLNPNKPILPKINTISLERRANNKSQKKFITIKLFEDKQTPIHTSITTDQKSRLLKYPFFKTFFSTKFNQDRKLNLTPTEFKLLLKVLSNPTLFVSKKDSLLNMPLTDKLTFLNLFHIYCDSIDNFFSEHKLNPRDFFNQITTAFKENTISNKSILRKQFTFLNENESFFEPFIKNIRLQTLKLDKNSEILQFLNFFNIPNSESFSISLTSECNNETIKKILSSKDPLKTYHISFKGIKGVDLRTICLKKFKFLKSISIYKAQHFNANQFNTISDTVTSINLSNISVKHFDFSRFKRLKSIALSHVRDLSLDQLHQLPDSLNSISLNISSTHFDFYEFDLSRFAHLNKLTLGINTPINLSTINTLPSSLDYLCLLETQLHQNNQINSLQLDRLENLKVFYAPMNITEFVFTPPRSLEELGFSDTIFQAPLFQLTSPNLNKVFFANCDISNLEPRFFNSFLEKKLPLPELIDCKLSSDQRTLYKKSSFPNYKFLADPAAPYLCNYYTI